MTEILAVENVLPCCRAVHIRLNPLGIAPQNRVRCKQLVGFGALRSKDL